MPSTTTFTAERVGEKRVSTAAAVRAPEEGLQPYSLRELVWYFLRLGTAGFGGPIALVGYMQRDLVETTTLDQR